MKKWVSLFLTESHSQGIKINSTILDKALYLFSNIRDFELDVDDMITESQRNYIITAQYYYRCYLAHCYQMNIQAWRSFNASKNEIQSPIGKESKESRTPKKLNAKSEAFKPIENIRNSIQAPNI